MLLLLGGLAVVVALVMALANQPPDSPGSGISRSDAIQLAWARPNGSQSTTTQVSGLPPNSPIRLDRSSR
jgi:hypothetical protein